MFQKKESKKRLDTKYLDEYYDDFDTAIKRALEAKDKKEAVSIAVKANAADFFKYVLDQGINPDLVTDQTSAHDPINGYVPYNLSEEEINNLRIKDPKKYEELSNQTMRAHVECMLAFQKMAPLFLIMEIT